MPCGKLVIGDEVAILPDPEAKPSEVLAIEAVHSIGPTYVQLTDGNRYNRFGGGCLNDFLERYAVPATDEHRAEHARKQGLAEKTLAPNRRRG